MAFLANLSKGFQKTFSKNNKQEAEPSTELPFRWHQLESENEKFVPKKPEKAKDFSGIRFDPRFHDLAIVTTKNDNKKSEAKSDNDDLLNDGKIVMSDTLEHERILEWKLSQTTKKYKLNQIYKVSEDYKSTKHIGRRFDRLGCSLAWTESRIDSNEVRTYHLFLYNIENEKFYTCELSQWFAKEHNDWKDVRIPDKQIINLGNGKVLFTANYLDKVVIIDNENENDQNSGNDKNENENDNNDNGNDNDYDNEFDNRKKNEIRKYVIMTVEFNLATNGNNEGKNAIKEITFLPIDSPNVLNNFEYIKYHKCHVGYWGFDYNYCYNMISVLFVLTNIETNLRKTHILLISLVNGSVIWNDIYDDIQTLSFNENGKYMAIFERSKQTETGFVRVLNVPRLEWLCEMRLEYGGVPIGWDGFTWSSDSLVFIAPYSINIVPPKDNIANIIIEKFINDKKNGKKSENQENAEKEKNENGNNSQNTRKIFSQENFTQYSKSIKGREICVFGIGHRWWDIEPTVLNSLTKLVQDDNVSKMILDFAGLNWCLIRFPYPLTQDETARGAVSEVLYSRFLSDNNVLLLGKAARGPFINIHDRWVFYACHLLKDFGQMWKFVKKWQKDNNVENNSMNKKEEKEASKEEQSKTQQASQNNKSQTLVNVAFYMNTNVLGTDADMHQKKLIDNVVKQSEEAYYKVKQKEFEEQLQRARDVLARQMRAMQ